MNIEHTRIAAQIIPRPRELIAFGFVGAAAAAVHMIVVSLIVPLDVPPLAANVLGFSAALGVSFTGHQRWTFAAQRAERSQALQRFVTVAVAAFVFNESLYALLLRFTSLDYRIALAIVLIVVAGATFLASRHWAFRR